ncbi:hypothetical protein [Phytohabitans suffuscus]|uniref:Ricin B lectin domain-containing protein n=1 Tax=Phytohabitans suffuscus TaxID=624315 RepID=A0A6F8YA32_9ACTN|nr:hypothetical protein [Phytohabitans suffuscus]BCB82972.1 hypothetical protein Psuf_002850 [Phytohabitans suffuscus]
MARKWAIGAAALACAGTAVAWGLQGTAGADTGTPAQETPAATAGKPAAPPQATTRPTVNNPPVLSGKRMVTIVRSRAFEAGLSMDNGWLTEADDDSGRQRFVATPVGRGQYLIKSYGRFTDDPATREATCWQVYHPQSTEPLQVMGAPCDARDTQQRFTITTRPDGTYAISHSSAYLQHSARWGLILEELGDAPLLDTYRLTDIGTAPRD